VSIYTPSCVPAHLHSAPIKGLYDKLWWLHRPCPGTESPTPHSLGSYVRPAPPPSSLFGQATKGSHVTASRGITDDPPSLLSLAQAQWYTRSLSQRSTNTHALSEQSTPPNARSPVIILHLEARPRFFTRLTYKRLFGGLWGFHRPWLGTVLRWPHQRGSSVGLGPVSSCETPRMPATKLLHALSR
jgi:hypothetical protein